MSKLWNLFSSGIRQKHFSGSSSNRNDRVHFILIYHNFLLLFTWFFHSSVDKDKLINCYFHRNQIFLFSVFSMSLLPYKTRNVSAAKFVWISSQNAVIDGRKRVKNRSDSQNLIQNQNRIHARIEEGERNEQMVPKLDKDSGLRPESFLRHLCVHPDPSFWHLWPGYHWHWSLNTRQ